MINRLMSRASFSVKPAPHMGMALPVYTNGTSPLRKALDFCVHLQLKAMLGDPSIKTAPGHGIRPYQSSQFEKPSGGECGQQLAEL
jgi:exoribonuclease R